MKKVKEERGIYFIAVALTFFVLLAVVGLAIDVGSMQRYKLRVQRAVDAASLSTSWMLLSMVTSGLSGDDVKNTAEQLLTDNFSSMGISSPTIQVDLLDSNGTVLSSPYPNARQVRISATVNAPLYIMDLIPGWNYNSISAVSANATAGDVRLVVSLVLDRSGSMCTNAWPGCCGGGSCSSGSGNCFNGGGCGVPPGSAPCPCEKLERMKIAASAFINTLTDNDRAAIVTYSASATVNAPMAFMTSGPGGGKQTALAAIANFGGTGNTNAEDALRLGINEITKASTWSTVSPSDKKAVIFLSDGAPTAGGDLSGCSESTAKEYYLYAIKRADDARKPPYNIIFYTIGLGNPPVAYDPICDPSNFNPNLHGYRPDFVWMVPNSPPYNGYVSGNCAESSIRAMFMGRVANDVPWLSNIPTPTPPWTTPTPGWRPDYPCVDSNPTIAGYTQGEMFLTSDPGQLTGIFQQIGQTLRALLTQ